MGTGKKRQKGRYTVYIGVRVEKALKQALVAKAKKNGVDLGDAYRDAFRLYAGLSVLRMPASPIKIPSKFKKLAGIKKKAA